MSAGSANIGPASATISAPGYRSRSTSAADAATVGAAPKKYTR